MRELEEIYREMRGVYAERAGFVPNDNCDAAVRLYALAIEIQGLEAQADWVLAQSFPQTAEGEFLDHHAAMRALRRGQPACAEGTLRFAARGSAAADYAIPEGTVCLTAAGVRFETTADAVLAQGENYSDVPAKACEAGTSGNVIAGTVTLCAAFPAGIVSCTNPSAFAGGCDAESDDALRVRILKSYKTLPNGANAAFYEREARNVTGVAAAKAVGRARGIGTVDVYIASQAGLPSVEQLAGVLAALQSKREIAVDLRVLAPETDPIALQVEIETEGEEPFDAVRERVEETLNACFDGRLLGEGMTMARLTAAVFAVKGVRNCHLLAPAEDVPPDATHLPTMASCQITEIPA